MFFIIALTASALAETVAVPLPDAEAPAEAAPWEDPAEEGTHPPIAWSQIGDHRVGDALVLRGADGAPVRSCPIQSFELRSTDSEVASVWAWLDCEDGVLASR